MCASWYTDRFIDPKEWTRVPVPTTLKYLVGRVPVFNTVGWFIMKTDSICTVFWANTVIRA